MPWPLGRFGPAWGNARLLARARSPPGHAHARIAPSVGTASCPSSCPPPGRAMEGRNNVHTAQQRGSKTRERSGRGPTERPRPALPPPPPAPFPAPFFRHLNPPTPIHPPPRRGAWIKAPSVGKKVDRSVGWAGPQSVSQRPFLLPPRKILLSKNPFLFPRHHPDHAPLLTCPLDMAAASSAFSAPSAVRGAAATGRTTGRATRSAARPARCSPLGQTRPSIFFVGACRHNALVGDVWVTRSRYQRRACPRARADVGGRHATELFRE